MALYKCFAQPLSWLSYCPQGHQQVQRLPFVPAAPDGPSSSPVTAAVTAERPALPQGHGRESRCLVCCTQIIPAQQRRSKPTPSCSKKEVIKHRGQQNVLQVVCCLCFTSWVWVSAVAEFCPAPARGHCSALGRSSSPADLQCWWEGERNQGEQWKRRKGEGKKWRTLYHFHAAKNKNLLLRRSHSGERRTHVKIGFKTEAWVR